MDGRQLREVFQAVALGLAMNGVHPTPGAMQRALGRKVTHNLGGREVRWLRAVAGRKRPAPGGLGNYPLCDLPCCVGGKD